MSAVERQPDGASVALVVPVRADLIVLARLTAATVASRAGFGVEEIEDLRLAVEELCLSLVSPDDDGRLHFDFSFEREVITVTCWVEPRSGWNGAGGGTDELSLRILDALVDEHGRELRDGKPCAWLRKRRAHPSA